MCRGRRVIDWQGGFRGEAGKRWPGGGDWWVAGGRRCCRCRRGFVCRRRSSCHWNRRFLLSEKLPVSLRTIGTHKTIFRRNSYTLHSAMQVATPDRATFTCLHHRRQHNNYGSPGEYQDQYSEYLHVYKLSA